MATTYAYRFIGATPLIMDADNIDQQDVLKQWIQDNPKQSTKGDDRTPPWGWKLKLYNDGTHVAIPCDMLISAITAATKIPLKGNESYKRLAAASISPLEEYMPLVIGPKGKRIAVTDIEKIEGTFAEQAAAVQAFGFRLFVKPARPPTTKSRHVRVRPRFDKWEFAGHLRVTDAIPRAILIKILEKVGELGFGNWSPRQRSPGPFGTAEAKLTLKR